VKYIAPPRHRGLTSSFSTVRAAHRAGCQQLRPRSGLNSHEEGDSATPNRMTLRETPAYCNNWHTSCTVPVKLTEMRLPWASNVNKARP
jgi:hypothetical protein